MATTPKLSIHDAARMGRRRLVIASITLAIAAAGTAMAQEACSPIQFQRGQHSAEISGVAPAHDRDDEDPAIACYWLAVDGGQKATVKLLAGDNVAITIPDVGDANDSFEFVTRRGTHELRVFQLFPGGPDQPFRIGVAVVD